MEVPVSTGTYEITGEPSSNHSLPVCRLHEYIGKVILYGVLVFFGLIGNGMSVLVFWPSRHRHASYFILITLAFLDSSVLISSYLMHASISICRYQRYSSCANFQLFVYPWMSAYLWNAVTISHMASTWTVVLVAVHRYVAVCLLHKAKKWGSVKMARAQVTCICLFFVVFNIPRWLDREVVENSDGSGYRTIPTALGENDAWDLAFNVIAYYIVEYVVPFIVLIACSTKLMVALRQNREKREQMTRSKREENRITKMLVVVMASFMVCQIMNPIRRALVYLLESSERDCGSAYAYFNLFSTFFMLLNSSCNFAIYYVYGPRFRQDLLLLLNQGGKVKIHPAGSTSQSYVKPRVKDRF